MKTSTALPLGIAFALTLFCSSLTGLSADSTSTNRVRIGVYDSRVIAVAYGNSPGFQDALKPVMEEHKKAKAAGDEKHAKAIEERMQLRQRRMHEQGFSTGSVIEIMSRVKDQLPGVAKAAGVRLIVSKWEVNFHSADVELVDVTDQVAALFHPNERGQKWLKQIPDKAPIPLEQLDEHHD